MKATLFKSLPFALAIALAAPGFAQETAPDTNASLPTDAATAEQSAVADIPTVDMGEIVEESRAPGQTYIESVSGDWERKCITMPEGQGEDPCQMYQLLKNTDGSPIAEISLGKLPNQGQAAAGATVVVPLETLLTQQLTISVDGSQARRYPFRFCAQPGCVANIGLTQAEVDAFKRGSKATLVIVPAAAPTQKIMMTMSLTGFTNAYDALIAPKISAQ